MATNELGRSLDQTIRASYRRRPDRAGRQFSDASGPLARTPETTPRESGSGSQPKDPQPERPVQKVRDQITGKSLEAQHGKVSRLSDACRIRSFDNGITQQGQERTDFTQRLPALRSPPRKVMANCGCRCSSLRV